MAHRRGRSEPGHREGYLYMNGDEQVIPFWSRRVQDAAVVDGLRQATLPQIPGTPWSLPPVPANEWDPGDETPRPVQGLLGAMGSGGGMVRSQGAMPTQIAFAEIHKLQDHNAPRCSG